MGRLHDGARVAVVHGDTLHRMGEAGQAESLHLNPKDEGNVLGFSSPKRNMHFNVAWDRYPGFVSHIAT